MGYQVTFVPTEEAMSKYKPWKEEKHNPEDSLVNIIKFEIISYCMNTAEEMPSKVVKQIAYLLRYLKGAVETEEKNDAYFRWKEDKDHQLWYCGWKFYHESHIDAESIMKDYIEKLFILTQLVKTPDYFSEHENFFTKYNDLLRDIDEFVELIQDIVIHDIINELDEFKVKDEKDEQD